MPITIKCVKMWIVIQPMWFFDHNCFGTVSLPNRALPQQHVIGGIFRGGIWTGNPVEPTSSSCPIYKCVHPNEMYWDANYLNCLSSAFKLFITEEANRRSGYM
jgi:hypothetical protein